MVTNKRGRVSALLGPHQHALVSFINRNIGVLSGTLLLLEGVNKTFVVWVELSSGILRDHFV